MIFGHQKNLILFSSYLAFPRSQNDFKELPFPHAVLFMGPAKIGKRRVAIEISKYLLGHLKKGQENFFEFSQKECSCKMCNLIEEGKIPEIIEVREEGQIPIKKIREIKERISLSSLYFWKIVILDNAETLSEEATGALLKILEEPRGGTLFFLLSSQYLRLPKTILSRVEIFKFQLLSKEELRKFLEIQKEKNSVPGDEKELSEIVDLSLGRPGLGKELLLDKNKKLYYSRLLEEIKKINKIPVFDRMLFAERIEREGRLEDFLFLAKFWFRDLLLVKNGISQISFEFKREEIQKESKRFSREEIKNLLLEIEKTRKYLSFSNTSRLLLLENLLLNI